MGGRRTIFLGLWLVLALLAPVEAGEGGRGFEFGFFAGLLHPDDDLSGPSRPYLEPAGGLRIGAMFSKEMIWFADALYSEIPTNTFRGEARELSGRSGFDLLFNPKKDTRWFFSGAGGFMQIRFDNATDFTSAYASVGLGQRVWLSGRKNIRWELRFDHALASDGLAGRDLDQAHFTIGLNWGPSGPGKDADGDGVLDRRDRCPGSRSRVVVDRVGCAQDGDSDRVPDGVDRCPGTPSGELVDNHGCSLDADLDGVNDGSDRCPNTAAGLSVDATGCPPDGDGDGVPDNLDRCSDTRAGRSVDDLGCPADSDDDGVPDDIDLCPRTPPAARVASSGCPTDGDGDGVWDGLDACPDTPWGDSVEADGCPSPAPLFEKQETLILDGVTFRPGSADLAPGATEILDRVAAALQRSPSTRVRVSGHTDSTGDDEINQRLSLQRAENVRDYLIRRGVASNRLEARGYGESRPISDNATAGGRLINRRVELDKLD